MGPSRTPKTGYHHGDLRTALLEAAVGLIQEKGLDKLSLRECARRAGVSHAAPYRHFEDKQALLWAIAEQGFAWLHAAGVAAMEGLNDPRERLDAYGVAYVRFAVEHPVHHRVMFSTQLQGAEPQETAEGGYDPSFQLLVDTARELKHPDQDPLEAAAAAWALPHGLSMLILDGRIPAEYIGSVERVEGLARALYRFWRHSAG